jgi:ectoine hydroxylase-related dioxygenase (phytanoyl-CoA dioxygenase family)
VEHAQIDALPPLDGHHPVTVEQIETFGRDGHALVPGLASEAEVAAYRNAIVTAARENNLETRAMEDRPTYNRAFLQTANLWRVDPVVQRFVFSPRFARVAAELLGVEGVRLYHDQALLKEAGGGHTPWHQDQFYWPFGDQPTITMWMALVDVPPEVGTMTFASGTHHLGALVDQPISDESEAAYAAIVEARGLPTHTYGAVQAGDATFHAGWTLHRAGPNPTDAMRSVMTVIYVADGAVVEAPANPYQEFDRQVWLDGTEPGELVGTSGALNPRLHPPEH